VIIPSTTFFLSTFKHSYNGRKPPWQETKGKQLHSSNLYLESAGTGWIFMALVNQGRKLLQLVEHKVL